MEKEIKKANIPTVDTGENPEVPFPRDMIDLEVIILQHSSSISIHLIDSLIHAFYQRPKEGRKYTININT